MFMLDVTLPGWDCVCMHAFLYLYELKCVNVHQVTCVFLSFSFGFCFFFILFRNALDWALYAGVSTQKRRRWLRVFT